MREMIFLVHAEDFDARNDLLIPYYVYNILYPQDPVAGAVELFLAGDVDRNKDAGFRTVDDGVELDDVDLLFVDLVEHVDEETLAVHGDNDELDVIA